MVGPGYFPTKKEDEGTGGEKREVEAEEAEVVWRISGEDRIARGNGDEKEERRRAAKEGK